MSHKYAKLMLKLCRSGLYVPENIYLCHENRFINSSLESGHKLSRSWLIKLMMIAPLAEHASMNARWRLFLKVISIKLIPKHAQIVVPVPMFAR